MAIIQTVQPGAAAPGRVVINDNFIAINAELAAKETPAGAQAKADAAQSAAIASSSGSLASHVSASDPHGDRAASDPAGTAAATVSAHDSAASAHGGVQKGATAVAVSGAGNTALTLTAGDSLRVWNVTVTSSAKYTATLSLSATNAVDGSQAIVRVSLPGGMNARIDLRSVTTVLDSAIENHVARLVIWRLVFAGGAWVIVSRIPTAEVMPFTRTVCPGSFEGSGTGYFDWRLPLGCMGFNNTLIGGGAGGGSGMRGAAGTARFGGSAGTGGTRTDVFTPAMSLPSLKLRITCGLGGLGGAAPTTDNTAGNFGTNGAYTTVLAYDALETTLILEPGVAASSAGGRGQPGTTAQAAAAANSYGYVPMYYSSSNGSTAATQPAQINLPGIAPAAGASGAGVDASNVAGIGGSSYTTSFGVAWCGPRYGGTGAGAAGGGNGGDADTVSGYDWVIRPFGRAGGGGGGNAAGGGGRGGDGSFPGGGGGGAGGGTNGTTGGRGGNGADGCAILTLFY